MSPDHSLDDESVDTRRDADAAIITTALPLRVAVIGAECTGKTTLCRKLAADFGGAWVPEALREFVDLRGRPPVASEQAWLLEEQLRRERTAHAAAANDSQPLVIFDSAPLVTALCSRMYFGDDTLLAAATEHHRSYDLMLVTDIDLPWQADGIQRDGPAVRERFHTMLIAWLGAVRLPFRWVRGIGGPRSAGAAAQISAKLAVR